MLAAESKTSLKFGITSIPSVQGLYASPSNQDLSNEQPFKQIFKDQSVTRLSNEPFMSDFNKSMEKLPTATKGLASKNQQSFLNNTTQASTQ